MSTYLLLVTLIHVPISVLALMAGTVVVRDMLAARVDRTWTALYLALSVFNSATGYLFPVSKVLPAHIVGAITLAILAVAVYAFYVRALGGAWRWIYVVSAVAAFYFNVFVGIVQAFLKIPVLQQSSPTQTELPFAATQLVVVLVFIAIGAVATRKFHPNLRAS